MIINVGSKNPGKVEAVERVIKDYPLLMNANIVTFEAQSGIEAQPIGLRRIRIGAENRATNSFKNCDLSIGLESGLMQMPEDITKYIDVCACIVYDGKRYHYGQSAGFEIPKKIMAYIFAGSNLSEASFKAGVTANPNIGTAEGLIGILTNNRITRADYTVQALQMALIGIEKGEFYQ